jgi:sortase A
MAHVAPQQPVTPAQPEVADRGSTDLRRATPRRYVRVVGELLISVGVGILLFVAWELWGTGLYTAQQQDRLGQELDRKIEAAAERPGHTDAGPPRGFAPAPGDPVFRMSIPAIRVTAVVVEGVDTRDLRKGPGHYPSCRPGFAHPLCTDFQEVWPGERGRVVVSGHRTTYGAEFNRIDQLKRGDEIRIESEWGRFVYDVTRQQIVQPDSRKVTVPSDRFELALTTCNPKYSAAQRLVVYAELERT